jgi:hypothetical protein
MRNVVLSSLAGMSLLSCLIAPVLFFLGKISETDYKGIFLLASIAWFVFATLRIFVKKSD